MKIKKALKLFAMSALTLTLCGTVASCGNGDVNDDNQKPPIEEPQVQKFTITFNVNGTLKTVEVDEDSTYNFSDYTPSLDGYTFEGWYTDANFTDKVESDSVIVTKDMTFYAKMVEIIVSHELTLVVDGVETVLDVEEGQFDLSTKVPTKDGYEFKGWFTSSDFVGESVGDTINITENTTLYAKFEKIINTFTVSLNMVDMPEGATGGCGSLTGLEFVEGTEINLYDILAENGYDTLDDNHFISGWYTDAAYTNEIENGIVTITSNMDFYAKVERKQVELTIHLDDNLETITLKKGETINLLDYVTFDQEVYESVEFFADENYSTKLDSSLLMDGNKEVYARLVYRTFNITISINGKVTELELKYGQELNLNDYTPELESYNFVGWYSDKTFSNEITDERLIIKGDIDIYAKLERKKVEITIVIGEYVETYEMNINQPMDIYSYIPMDTNYFDYIIHVGDINGEIITGTNLPTDKDYTYVVEMVRKAYKIDVMIENNKDTYKVNVGETFQFLNDVVIPDYYNLEGWYYDEAFQNKVNVADVITTDFVIYGKVSVKEYTVTIVGLENVEIAVSAKDNSINLLDYLIVPEGYEFKGFFLDSDYTTSIESTISVKNDLTIYALIEKIEEGNGGDEDKQIFTVHIIPNVAKPYEIQLEEGAVFDITSNIQQIPGHIFIGFYLDGELLTENFVVTKDVELEARYQVADSAQKIIDTYIEKNSLTEEQNYDLSENGNVILQYDSVSKIATGNLLLQFLPQELISGDSVEWVYWNNDLIVYKYQTDSGIEYGQKVVSFDKIKIALNNYCILQLNSLDYDATNPDYSITEDTMILNAYNGNITITKETTILTVDSNSITTILNSSLSLELPSDWEGSNGVEGEDLEKSQNLVNSVKFNFDKNYEMTMSMGGDDVIVFKYDKDLNKASGYGISYLMFGEDIEGLYWQNGYVFIEGTEESFELDQANILLLMEMLTFSGDIEYILYKEKDGIQHGVYTYYDESYGEDVQFEISYDGSAYTLVKNGETMVIKIS